MTRRKRVVAIGGGTGTYTVLSGLGDYPLDLSAVVSMMDSGGSNRVIRDEFGLLPTSDIRQCMVALASEKSHKMLRELFTYRYSQGTGIEGMTFGNLFMAALTEIHNSQEKAIEITSEMLGVEGQILPVTFDKVHLIARYENGEQVLGEHLIDEPESVDNKRIVELGVIPKATANIKAINAIKNADLIVLGPGDLYTSVICNLVIGGVAKAIRDSKAIKVHVMNLMTKVGETSKLTASGHLSQLHKYLEAECLDYCLVNKTNSYPKGALAWYKRAGTKPVKDDLKNTGTTRIIRRSLISRLVYKKQSSDKVKRSLIRHDSKKLAKAIASLL